MVAEPRSGPQDELVPAAVGADAHQPGLGSSLSPTLGTASTASTRPWRKTIIRQVYRPGSELPQPPPAPLDVSAPATATTAEASATAAADSLLPSTPEGIATAVADELVDQMVNATSVPQPLARATGTVIKSTFKVCARRLARTPEIHGDEGLLGSDDEDENIRHEEPQSGPCIDTTDTTWRQYVHLRKNEHGRSSLEECMKEWHIPRGDDHGNVSTLMVRDRIEDVAYHVVHLQEAFVAVVGKINGVTSQHATLLDGIHAVF